MTFPYLDAHTHAQFSAYDGDRDAVLSRAREAGVRMVNVGTTRKTSEAAVALARAYPDLCYATVGVHPSHASVSYHDVQELGKSLSHSHELAEREAFDPAFYAKLAGEERVVAIGECGLDYARDVSDEVKQKQRDLFLAHLKFAKEIEKPLMIHCRSAFPDLLQLLTTHYQLLTTKNPGIIHFFTGTPEEAKDLFTLGFSFTFGGVITFARDYDEVIKMIPMDRILSETDAPYVTPAPYRGKRNEPAYVVEVVKKLAELKGVGREAMAVQIRKNAERILTISK
ncbi:MAG: TatD family hydrolase [Candidatus Jorgensenbacteria bacterium]|nr:TatD family hydrolase [Candidatus Jorgensenbacteria bacterium]